MTSFEEFMKRITVKYNEQKSNRTVFWHKIKEVVTSRLPGGRYPCGIMEAVRLDRKIKTKESRTAVRYFVLNYMLGSTLFDRMFPEHKKINDRFFIDLHSLKIPYTSGRYLYHYVPEEWLESVKDNGIIASDRSDDRNGLVFLSYAPEFLTKYLKWKVEEKKKDTVFVLLKIDSKRLSERHKLYYYREFEVVTDRVEPEYIVWES